MDSKTLRLEHSELLWILWIFISLLSIIGGIIYFIRFLTSKEYNGLKNQLTLIFLFLSVIGIYGIAKVVNRLEKYFLPTSEKTEYGFTIYPPLTAYPEQLEQLNNLKSQAYFANGFMIFLLILLIITALITWEKEKKRLKMVTVAQATDQQKMNSFKPFGRLFLLWV